MLSKEQLAVNVCREYINYVEKLSTQETDASRRYIFLLRIREWQLERAVKNLHRLEDLETLRHGHFLAEQFYFDFADETSRDRVQINLIDILQGLAVEFHCEIAQIEAENPALRATFARDKEVLRQRWNFYVEDALEMKNIRARAV